MSEEKGKEAEKKQKKQGTPLAAKVLVLAILVMAGVFLPSTLVILVCMIPAFVAAMVDSQPQKTAWITVGAMNLAGTLPAWFSLWESGHDMASAMRIITSPRTLIIAYGGAAIGWIVYNNVTPLVAGVVVSKNERRLKEIEKRQKELLRKWGDDVAKR